jgi:multiple antibiotic resistance protein
MLSFIPIMVALDAPGTLPLYVGMTEGMEKQERKRIVRQSIITAFLVAVGFILGTGISTPSGSSWRIS